MVIAIPIKDKNGKGLICTASFPNTFLIEPPVLKLIMEAVTSLVWRRN
jgi:hypothetical protein